MLKIDDSHSDTKLLFAKIYEKEEKVEEQIEMLKSALNNSSENELLYFELASAYGKLGNQEMEKKYYFEASKLGNIDASRWLNSNKEKLTSQE